MATGNQADPVQVNAQLSSTALQLRNWATAALNYAQYVNKLGLAGLENMGFIQADAQQVLSQADYMQTIAQIYKGTATQATAFDFEDALCGLWAAQ
jgi:hypothetical protein